MSPLFIYLIGALIGFGISYSAYDITKANGEPTVIKRGPFLLFGTVLSWLTVLLFLGGLLSGLFKNDDGDGE